MEETESDFDPSEVDTDDESYDDDVDEFIDNLSDEEMYQLIAAAEEDKD